MSDARKEMAVANKELETTVDTKSLAGSTSEKSEKSADSESIADLQKKEAIDAETLAKVQKQSTHMVLRLLRFISSEYRILFTLVFSANLVGLIEFFWHWGHFGSPSKTAAALATSINLAVSIVIREEHVVNSLYAIFASLPSSWPLWIRRRMGKIYHLGGFHSGCGVAATFWFIVYSIQKSCYRPHGAEQIILLVITWLLDCLLISMCIMAHPDIRNKLHNHFEIVHRFAGWSALAFLWTLTVLDEDINRMPNVSLAKALFTSANVYLLFLVTISIVITWTNMRKIKVNSERLSSHALRIYFDYTTPDPGTTIRLSTSPLFEWHAFATVAQPGTEGFSLIISNAGDWTKRLINEPPREIYARRTPTCGVMRIAPMFRSVLLVATGSGIAPCLPVILAQKTNINLFWSTRDPFATYGTEIEGVIKALGDRAYIHNTTTMGRPNTLPLVLQQYYDTQSEAVIVISNPKLTIKLVQDLEYLGVPAFGPIWDS